MWLYICIYHILCLIIIIHHKRHHFISRTTSKHEMIWCWYQKNERPFTSLVSNKIGIECSIGLFIRPFLLFLSLSPSLPPLPPHNTMVSSCPYTTNFFTDGSAAALGRLVDIVSPPTMRAVRAAPAPASLVAATYSWSLLVGPDSFWILRIISMITNYLCHYISIIIAAAAATAVLSRAAAI